MLCLPGLTPVWNVDQATGESGRHRRAQRLEAAPVAQAGQVGELALVEHRLGQAVIHAVEPEDDHPLEPGLAQRPPAEEGPRSSRTGQVMKVSSAEPTAAKTAKNEPARAKPAPGPM